MLVSGLKKRSISDQTGSFGFDFSLSLNDTQGECQIGFSGDHVSAFNFTSGKIYDPQDNFVGAYAPNERIEIAGQIRQNSYDYSINGNPIAQDFPCSSGKYSWFFVETQPQETVADISVAISGHIPEYSTSGSGYYQGSGTDVRAYIFNQSPGINFRLFDVEINNIGGPYSLKSFTTGDIATSGEIVLTSNALTNYSATLPLTLYTNFGEVDFDFFIGANTNGPQPDNSIYLTITPNKGSVETDTTQLYSLYYSSYPSGALIDVSLSYSSGFTGTSSGNVLSTNFVNDFVFGEIVGSGYLTNFYSGNLTGHDSVRNQIVTGQGSGYLSSDIVYASGPVSIDYYIKVSGQGKGTVYQDLMMEGYAPVEVTADIPYQGAYVTALAFNVVGSGGLNQTAIIPVATGSVFLYPTGTTNIHFESGEYSPSVLIKDECFVGPVNEDYNLIGVGYAVGPTLTGIVDSNFKYSANPGTYTFTKTFNNLVQTSGFIPLALFDPIRCAEHNNRIFSGLINGTVTSGGYSDCSLIPSCLIVSGVPTQIFISGSGVVNSGVVPIIPNEGFLSTENSLYANAHSGYTRTTVSSQDQTSQVVFNQIVQGCNYLGEWAQKFSNIKYSGYQLIPQPCDFSSNSPSYVGASALINGLSQGGYPNKYPLVSGSERPDGYYTPTYTTTAHEHLLVDFGNQAQSGVDYTLYLFENVNPLNDKNEERSHVGTNPVVSLGLGSTHPYTGLAGIITLQQQPGDPALGDKPVSEWYYNYTFNYLVNFPGQNFDGFKITFADTHDSIAATYFGDLEMNGNVPLTQRSVMNGGVQRSSTSVSSYPTAGAPALESVDFNLEQGASNTASLYLNRSAPPGIQIFADAKIYGIINETVQTGEDFTPYPDFTHDSGVLKFTLDGSGSTKKLAFRALLPASSYPNTDLILFKGDDFYAYNSGYRTQSIARDSYFNSYSDLINNAVAPSDDRDAAFILDLPTGDYRLVVRAVGNTGYTYVNTTGTQYPPTLDPPIYRLESTSEGSSQSDTPHYIVISSPHYTSGANTYGSTTVHVPGDKHSGIMTVELFDLEPNDGLYIRDMYVQGGSYNNSSVDCSVQYSSPSPCEMPLLGWIGRQASLGEMDYAVIRYIWNNVDGGSDLDTITSLQLPSVSGYSVGWDGASHPNLESGYMVSGSGVNHSINLITGANGEILLFWGGDNTNPQGDETVLINFKAIKNNYPGISDIPISLNADWYGGGIYGGASGNITVQFESFVGGVLAPFIPSGQSTIDWTPVSGGRSVQKINTRYNITGYRVGNLNSCGVLHYLPNQEEGYFDYGPGLITVGSNIIHPIHTGTTGSQIDLSGFTNSGAYLAYYEDNIFVESNLDWSTGIDYASINNTPYAPFNSGSAAIYSQAPLGTIRKISARPEVTGETKILLNVDPIYDPTTYWMSGVPYTGNTLPTGGTFSGSILSMISDSIWMNYDMSSGVNNNNVVGYSLSLMDNMTGNWLPFSFYGFGKSGAANPCNTIIAHIADGCKPINLEQDVCVTGDYIPTDVFNAQIKQAMAALGYSPNGSQNSFSVSTDPATGYYFYTGAIVFNNPQTGDTVSFRSYAGNYTGSFSGKYGALPTYPEIDRTWTYGTDFNTADGLVTLINQNLYAQSYNLWVPALCDPGDNSVHYEYGPLLQAVKVSDSYIQLLSARGGEAGNYQFNINTSAPSSGYTKEFLRPSVVTLQARNSPTGAWVNIDTHSGLDWSTALKLQASGYLNDFGVNPLNTGTKDNNDKDQPKISGSGSNLLVDLMLETGLTTTDTCGNINSVDIKFFRAPFSGSCTPPDTDDDDNPDKDHNDAPDPNNPANGGNPFLTANIVKTGWNIVSPASHNYYRLLLSGFDSYVPTVHSIPAVEFYATNVEFYGLGTSPTYFSGQTSLEGAHYSVDVAGLATGQLIGTATAEITPEMSGQFKWNNYQIVERPYRNRVRFNTGLLGSLVGENITGYLNTTTIGEGLVYTQIQGYFYDDPATDLVSFTKTISGNIQGCGQVTGGPFNVIDGDAWAIKTATLKQTVSTSQTILVSGVSPHIEYPFPVSGLEGFAYYHVNLDAYVSGTGSYTFNEVISVVPETAYQNAIDSYVNAFGYLQITGNLNEGDTFSINNIDIEYSLLSGSTAPTYFSTFQGLTDIINSNPSGFNVEAFYDTGLQVIYLESLISGSAGNDITLQTTATGAYFFDVTMVGGVDNHLTMTPQGVFSGLVFETVYADEFFTNVPASGTISGYLNIANETVHFTKLWDLQTGNRLGMTSFTGQGWMNDRSFRLPSGLAHSLLSSPGSFNIGVTYFGEASSATPDVATLRISGINFPSYLEFNITGSQ